MYYQIPVELLINIFMFLSPCTDLLTILKVCKRWRDVGLYVLEQRKMMSLSAFTLRSPLSWILPKLKCDDFRCTAPSKRFGSSVVLHKKCIYVFGGATREMTAFNDLWVYDLCTLKWKRIVGKGDFPTPRAHAKGGCIGDVMYFYGGCQSFHRPGSEYTGLMDWLTELNSFETTTTTWSRISLSNAITLSLDTPPIVAGQSGCFLPAGTSNEPHLLILFGGIAQIRRSCINDVYIVQPETGLWMGLYEPKDKEGDQTPWPCGRCGHSVCALDAYRMLLLFGNMDSPLASSFQLASSNRQHNYADNGEEVQSSVEYRGRPANDIWILTRCSAKPHQDWSTIDWHWTRVDVTLSPLGGFPPIDFYHAVSICVSRQQERVDTNQCANGIDNCKPVHRPNVSFNVVVVSQATPALLDEAVKQRRHWQRVKINSEISHSMQAFDMINNLSNHNETASQLVVEHNFHNCVLPESYLCPKSNRRVKNRRTRRLEALAQQERKLFGSFRDLTQSAGSQSFRSLLAHSSTSSSSSTSQTSLPNMEDSNEPPTHPLALYSLIIRQSEPVECQTMNRKPEIRFEATWLVQLKRSYLDLVFGPQECLGYACTYGYGCLFLLGGLTDSDEASRSSTGSDEALRTEDKWNRTNAVQKSGSLTLTVEHNASGPNRGSLTPRSNQQQLGSNAAQFYVLRARSLAGTLH